MKNIHIKLFFVLIVPMLALGCANQTFTVKPELVASFEARGNPTDSETHVYVIRGSQSQGGGRNVLIGVNDAIYGALSNKTHSFLKLESGINTISLVQSGNAFSYMPVDFRPGETVFIYMDYEVGTLSEARPPLGKTMVQETNFKAPYTEAKKSSDLNAISLNPGWLDLDFMKEGEAVVSGDSGYGVITIGRPGVEFKRAILDMWIESSGLIGSLSGESFVQVKVPAGKHKIFAYLRELSMVEIDVVPNQNYYVEARLVRGYSGSKLELTPVLEGASDSYPETWTTSLEHKVLDSQKTNLPEVKKRIEMGLSKFEEIMSNREPRK